MIKIFFFLIIYISVTSCSLDKKSNIWKNNDNKKNDLVKVKVDNKSNNEKQINKAFNSNIKINLPKKFQNNSFPNLTNNHGRYNFDIKSNKKDKLKFKKISNFSLFETDLIFDKTHIIFFEKNGSIIKYDDSKNIIWKKNYYSKKEKKLKPVLFFAKNKNDLIVADSISNYYKIDLNSGKLLWSKKNLSSFNSEIKIFNDKFYVIDLDNTLNCFSLKDGKKLWNFKTENFFIKSKKRLSIVIKNNVVYFNNSVGDITALNASDGSLIWQLPTQNSQIYAETISLEISNLVLSEKSIYFSTNKGNFFSLNKDNGLLNWKQNISSTLKPIIVDNFLLTVTERGYLILIDKFNGNIIKSSNLLSKFKNKKKIKPSGFVLGNENIYLTTSNGKLVIVDIKSTKLKSIVKIDNGYISRPFIRNKNLYIIKNNSIIKFN